MMRQHAELLERRTGQGVPEWRTRITQQTLKGEPALRSWLTSQGVEGYPQQLLVFETFGYPDFLTATADDLIDAQYADRPALRPILDRLIEVAEALDGPGQITVQARKGFVTLQTRRRKFAVIRPATNTRVNLGLRPAATGEQHPVPASRPGPQQRHAHQSGPQHAPGDRRRNNRGATPGLRRESVTGQRPHHHQHPRNSRNDLFRSPG